jgi:hypothetical protein
LAEADTKERLTVAKHRAAHARSGFPTVSRPGRGAHARVEATSRRPAAGRLAAVLAGGALLGGAGFFGLTAAPAFGAANVTVHGTGSKTGTGPRSDVATATAFHGFAAASAGQGSSSNRDDTATAVADDGVAIAIAG